MKDVPVEIKGRYTLKIDGLGKDGEGVGRIQRFPIFVPKVIPGDEILVEIDQVKRNYGRGHLVKLIESSPGRVEEICSVAQQCGGCQLMHVSYKAQLDFKTQIVKDAIERIGKFHHVTVNPILGMKDPFNYRNKAQFPLRRQRGRVQMGFFLPGTHDIVDIQECHIQHSLINAIIEVLKPLLDNVSIYDEEKHTGLLRHVAIRVSSAREEAMVIFVTRTEEFFQGDAIANSLMKRFPQVVSVLQNINPERTNVIFGKKTCIIKGRDFIEEEVDGLRFRISPLSFFQVNTSQMEVLYSKVMEYSALLGSEDVIDAYCGAGAISLFLARKSRMTWGIEEVPEAIEMAKTNAFLNGIEGVSFLAGKVEDVLPRLYREGIRPHLIVTDPPRKGCQRNVLEVFAAMKPQRIIYVSCNPTTLARDLAYLEELGYHTLEVQPVDMFPFTVHVETICLMSKK